MRLLLIFLCSLVIAQAPGTERRLALSFDDLPAAASGRELATWQRLNADLLAALAEHDAPALALVNEGKLEVGGVVDPDRLAILETWLEAGHELGNHGKTHLDINRVAVDEWQADVVAGELFLRPLGEDWKRPLRFFRHPYLHTGADAKTRDETMTFLAEHGYRVAPVSIDNQEWIWAAAYLEAVRRDNTDLKQRIEAGYIDQMIEVCAFWDSQSRQILGRPMGHILLLHANLLNAATLDRLLTRLVEDGWAFIDIDEALADPFWSKPTTWTGRAGISWLHRYALAENVESKIFTGEPEAPVWVRELAGID